MGLHCDIGALSSCGEQALKCVGSVVAARGILVPLPEIKPASSALESGFPTAGPPGKSSVCYLEVRLRLERAPQEAELERPCCSQCPGGRAEW